MIESTLMLTLVIIINTLANIAAFFLGGWLCWRCLRVEPLIPPRSEPTEEEPEQPQTIEDYDKKTQEPDPSEEFYKSLD